MKKFRRKVLDMLMSNNSGSSLRQQLLDGAPFRSSLLYTAVPQFAASGTTGTFTRATTSTWKNNDGYMVTGVAGEIGFVGARRVRNLLTLTEDFSTAVWSKSNASMSANQIAAPNGTTTADLFTATANAQQTVWFAAGITGVYSTVYSAYVKAGTATWLNFTLWDGAGVLGGGIQVWFNLFTGAVGSSVVGAGFSLTGTSTESVGNGWYRIAIAGTATGGAFVPAFRITDSNGVNATTATNGKTFYIWGAQVEDVTAQTTQTAGEYVSVGVESAPYYHGSGVDGVKCFPTDLAGNALPTSYTYDAVSLNGVAGTYVSTPDSVAASITGDIDIRVAFTTTSLTTDQVVISKTTAAAGNKSWVLYLNNAGKMQGLFYHDGTNLAVNFAASVTLASLGFSANSRIDVRATYQTSSSILTWYYSTDSGATWTSMGASSFVGVAGIFDGNAPVELGTQFAGTSLPLSGKVYEAQIYNGINGTLAVDFDASRYNGGTTLTGSTGETWTLNGSAVIHPTNIPMLGYQAQGARTNLCLQSNAFTTTWADGGAAPVQNTIGPDGATSAWTLTDNSAIANENMNQSVTLTAAAYTFSVFVKKTTGAQATYPAIYALTGTTLAVATIDTSNGIATAWTAYAGLTMLAGISARCNSYNSDFWRVELTYTGTVAAYIHYLLPAVTTNPTQSTGAFDVTAQGSAVFYGAQVELGSFASSYIPTTTIAVARNADVLTYSSAGNILDAAGWCYAEYSSPAMTLLNAMAVVGDGGGTNRGPLLTRTITSGAHMFDGTNLNAGAAGTPANNTTITAVSTWGGSTATVCVDGVLGAQGAYDGSYGLTSLGIGYGAVGLFGTIRSVRIGQRQLSASELGAITS